jgi:hypothetical protein
VFLALAVFFAVAAGCYVGWTVGEAIAHRYHARRRSLQTEKVQTFV